MDQGPSTHYSWWFKQPIDVKDWPLLIDGCSQLFVDDHMIAGHKNVQRQFHQAKPYEGNPVLVPEHPWESTTCLAHGTVLREPSGRLRMYYMPWVGEERFGEDVQYKPTLLPCLAFSDDGIHWEKPKLGLYPYCGRTDTNLILPNAPEETAYDQMSVIYDEKDTDPARRWKLGIKHSGKGVILNDPSDGFALKVNPDFREDAGYFAYFSQDGLHWNQHPEPIMTDGWTLKPRQKWPHRGVFENQSIMYDRARNKFVATVRIMDCRPGITEFWRARGICESDDFIHWTTPRVQFLPLEDDEPGLQFYSSMGFNYESMYLGLLRCYRSKSTHQLYFQLISSRDGIHWERAAHRQPFIPNQPLGTIGGGYHSDFSNPPFRMGDELWFYYGSSQFGKNVRPNVGGICISKLRVDGFASIEGGIRTGELITRPLDFNGKGLTLNLSCRGGSIVVELLDRHYQPIPEFTADDAAPVTGDHLAAKVAWKKHQDLSALAGKTIRLKFHITSAGLYSFAIR